MTFPCIQAQHCTEKKNQKKSKLEKKKGVGQLRGKGLPVCKNPDADSCLP